MTSHSEDVKTMLFMLPKDGTTADQVVGEVTAHQAYNQYGPLEREPGDGY